VLWNVGVVECWRCGLLALWIVGVVEYRYSRMGIAGCCACGISLFPNGNSGQKRIAALQNKGRGCGLLGYACAQILLFYFC
jgi:hypothetical protein